MRHLRDLKALLAAHSIALVLDATRVVENARFIIEHEPEFVGQDLWHVVRELLCQADAVIGSLAKDFCINRGGVIATNDPDLYRRIQDAAQEGGTLDVIDRKLVALSLRSRKFIETQVARRMDWVRSIWSALQAHGVPVVEPVGGHCILIDVKRVRELAEFEYPVASFLAWLYLNTGIRAGLHSVGMQKRTSVNDLVRLAIPLGFKRDQVDDLIARLVQLFQQRANIPEVLWEGGAGQAIGDVHAKYKLKKLHRVPVPTRLIAVPTAKGTSAEVPPLVKEALPAAVGATPDTERRKTSRTRDIAIVGVAGRYPKARNLQELWKNLVAGRDCIEEIPPGRYEPRLGYAAVEKYRGGFIDDVDKFDSLFFNISPKEAQMLDPQERLFLEVAWEAIEDAGYYPEILAAADGPRNIGVFVGAVWAMYQMLGVEERHAGHKAIPNSFLWSIANRISYWMNLTGPSLTIDTACSSSLTALYLACESIRAGECSAALVGGVNLDLHQSKFDINWGGGALSRDGVCRSFGQGANGYVAGEGVGALLIKPLDRAIEDGDHIHGVIKSVVVNHGGRTSGYTVPNPKAQTDLILAALEKADIDARSIGYVEAHGTGTELGDPIEITGLSSAFEKYGATGQSCAIGSIKTNIGHLEAAAGVVSISKVLLQMEHCQLVPSLHSARLNPFIDFSKSPFYVEQKLEEWRGKVIDGVRYPLRAAVSSFGAGGANAHVILEKYSAATVPTASRSQQELVFVLSARNEDQLRAMAVRLRTFIELDAKQGSTEDLQILADIAYTLQVGRKAFEHRAAITARTREELLGGLTRLSEGRGAETVATGHAKNAEGITRLLNRQEKDELIQLLSQRRDARRLAQLWVDGLLSEWRGFHTPGAAKRMSLPTYPFADRRHWVGRAPAAAGPLVQSLHAIHPLIDSNESTFERQLFKKTFNDRDFVIHDHSVGDIPTLPGVAYLELARKAAEIAAGRRVKRIRNILWVSPVVVRQSKPREVWIELQPKGDWVQFEVFSHDAEVKVLHSQGKLAYASKADAAIQPEYIDLEAIRARSTRSEATDAYPMFKSLGLDLGKSFQVLKELHVSESETLGSLQLGDPRSAELQSMILHPSLVDGSLQAGVAAQLRQSAAEMVVPYSIGEVEILHPLQATCFSYVTQAQDNRKEGSRVSRRDVLIVDEHGKVLVKIRDCVGVPLREVNRTPQQAQAEEFAPLYYSHDWERSAVAAGETLQDSIRSVLLFDTDESLSARFRERLRSAADGSSRVILALPAQEYREVGPDTYQLDPRNPQDFGRLLESLERQNVNIEDICFAWSARSLPGQDESECLRKSLETGVHAFLFLCQSLIEQKLEGKARLLYLSLPTREELLPHNEAMIGFTKALHLEHPKLLCKTLEIREGESRPGQMLDMIWTELHPATRDSLIVRYEEAERYVKKLKAIGAATLCDPADSSKIRKNGVYLITGGAGGLGLIFAEFLTRQWNARVILTGRSKLPPERVTQLEQLGNRGGGQLVYLPADVSDLEQVRDLVSAIRSRFGEINGIIHSAGVLRDSYIRNKTTQEMDAVFAPKVFGTVHLDAVTQADQLDFFVMFSSLAAVGGNAGQADYGFANSFMDAFAARRQLLCSQGRRSGSTLSLNWSIWADGGMQLDEQTETFFRKTLGIKPLSTGTGLEAFVRGLASGRTQLAVLEGVQEKIELAWGLRKRESSAPSRPARALQDQVVAAASGAGETEEQLAALVAGELSRVAMQQLKLDAADISPDQILLDLGFDSIGLTTYANAINEKYQLDITPVLFFDYPSIEKISEYLCSERRSEVLRFHRAPAAAAGATGSSGESSGVAAVDVDMPQSAPDIGSRKGWQPDDLDAGEADTRATRGVSAQDRFVDMPIAIVGMSGVMPQSEDLEEFWENLRGARDLISLIPGERWNWEEFHGDPLKEANKSNSKWGGFMKAVDQFDPLFFGISPREAQMMDPQQRIFLEVVWKAVEDSGHKVSDLAGTKTGLFVGVATNDYIDLMNSRQVDLDGYSASGNSHSVLANRVSFLLNLRGPSAPIDTACSSSLVALHRAIESIHTGSCEMAIVGGVQVMLTPAAYISFSMAGMLSSDGRCKTFDKRANGYVRGEGAGAILLKPLAKAEADGDNIYAVIRATAENHGGRVTTLTAPNASAQSELLVEAYEKARVDPATVGYIECHGTGTGLGDPIEIQALKTAFGELYKKQGRAAAAAPHCGLSAVKTNIGHLETAAGIAGILKVLLAIKHGQIPASLHFEELNPYIDLKASPFYIVDKTIPWEAPRSHDGSLLPRRAGVSSFGFGGANAHIVLEEYVPERDRNPAAVPGPQLIVLSAKNADRLAAYVETMSAYLEGHSVELVDLAYTLQVGRDAMPERLAFVASSLEEVKSKFRMFLENGGRVAGAYRNRVAKNKERVHGSRQRSGEVSVRSVVEAAQLSRMAELWVSGEPIDWGRLYATGAARRISIPTYPFARERYWLPNAKQDVVSEVRVRDSLPVATHLHPLIHRNASTLRDQKFASRFSGEEFFFADHVVKAQKILPGVAYMEMARVAGTLSAEQEVRCLRNIVWERPLIAGNEAREVETVLTPVAAGAKFSVRTVTDSGFITHCTGELAYSPDTSGPAVLDIAGILTRCPEQVISGGELYPFLRDGGLMLGRSFQIVQRIFANRSESVAVLALPEHLRKNADRFLLHPALMDGSLHTAIGLMKCNGRDIPLSVPYSVSEVQILGSLQDLHYGYATWEDAGESANPADPPVASFHLLDRQGKVLVRIKRLLSRTFYNRADARLAQRNVTSTADAAAVTWYRERWQRSHFGRQEKAVTAADCVLLVDRSDAVRAALQGRLTGTGGEGPQLVSVRIGQAFQALNRTSYEIDPSDESHYLRLIHSLEADGLRPGVVVHLWSGMDYETGAFDRGMRRGVYALFHLIQALQGGPGKVKVLYIYPNHPDGLQPQSAAVSAFFKSVSIDDSRFLAKTVEVHGHDVSGASEPQEIADCIVTELHESRVHDAVVRYCGGERFVKGVEKLDLPATRETALRERGVYLITGGLGGLGLVFAKFLARRTRARLALSGRSALDGAQKQKLSELEALGCEVSYHQADVADRAATGRLIEDIKKRFGRIDGVLHCAGVLRDAAIRKKKTAELDAVFAPKISGAIYLDEATKTADLDFFVVFSSLTAITGNAGQSDYAYANSFMSHFVELRNRLAAGGQRSGKALCLSWPLWKEGGMPADERVEALLRERLGIQPLDTEVGLETFTRSLASDESQILVMQGDLLKIARVLGIATAGSVAIRSGSEVPARPETDPEGDRHAHIRSHFSRDLMDAVTRVLMIAPDKFPRDTDMSEYGLDSVSLISLFGELNTKYSLDLTPAMFFEYPTFNALCDFVCTEYAEQLQAHLPKAGGVPPGGAAPADGMEVVDRRSTVWQERPLAADRTVAIVGMSGVFPGSGNVEEFWENLAAGRDLITEIPADRWDWRAYAGNPFEERNKTNSRWGGFMKDVDKFDSLFFGITPFEAELMDPQKRIFLETVWKAIEDSGHRPSELAGSRTGVFVGVAGYDYVQLLMDNKVDIVAYTATGMSHSVLPNRISYLLDLHGPSEPIDTACSSSLVAIHRAVEAISNGTCDMAIAGGVNVLLSPSLYIAFGNAGMLSSDGRCKTFDKRANGYVRGEGSGAVFLKALDRAIADGDHIYAVIRGSGVNHGGHATSLTAPNPNAQADLLIDVYRKAGVDPYSVTHIEAHGTGTPLGDPVELNGLKKAFKELYRSSNQAPRGSSHCAVGSVKTNIGHLETAAGIASVIKVLLSLKHRKIPGTVHYQEPNPHIRLEGSPFYIVAKTQDWAAVVDEQGREIPRIAGVSSFGFGGANAHVILQEYPESARPVGQVSGAEGDHEVVIPLSAKTGEQLRQKACDLLAYLRRREEAVSPEPSDVTDLAYTLQVGRDAMDKRVAFVVSSIPQLIEQLSAYVEGRWAVDERAGGKGARAVAWMQGGSIDWNELYGELKPRRLSLPTYPFARERYWAGAERPGRTPEAGRAVTALHPLLHVNTSNLREQSYCSIFSGEEFFLTGGKWGSDGDAPVERKFLSAGACLEMVRAAAEHAMPGRKAELTWEIRNTEWSLPLDITSAGRVTITLSDNGREQVDFEVCCTEIHDEARKEERIQCQGTAVLRKNVPAMVDIGQLKKHMRARMPGAISTSEAGWTAARPRTLPDVKAVYEGSKQILLHLMLPDAVASTREAYVLHPCLLDYAIYVALGHPVCPKSDGAAVFPLALDTLRISSACTQEMYAWIRCSRGSKPEDGTRRVDIDMTDADGRVCIALKSLSFESAVTEPGYGIQQGEFGSLLDSIESVAPRFPAGSTRGSTAGDFTRILNNIYQGFRT